MVVVARMINPNAAVGHNLERHAMDVSVGVVHVKTRPGYDLLVLDGQVCPGGQPVCSARETGLERRRRGDGILESEHFGDQFVVRMIAVVVRHEHHVHRSGQPFGDIVRHVPCDVPDVPGGHNVDSETVFGRLENISVIVDVPDFHALLDRFPLNFAQSGRDTPDEKL